MFQLVQSSFELLKFVKWGDKAMDWMAWFLIDVSSIRSDRVCNNLKSQLFELLKFVKWGVKAMDWILIVKKWLFFVHKQPTHRMKTGSDSGRPVHHHREMAVDHMDDDPARQVLKRREAASCRPGHGGLGGLGVVLGVTGVGLKNNCLSDPVLHHDRDCAGDCGAAPSNASGPVSSTLHGQFSKCFSIRWFRYVLIIHSQNQFSEDSVNLGRVDLLFMFNIEYCFYYWVSGLH